jgi:hypothetical protein
MGGIEPGWVARDSFQMLSMSFVARSSDADLGTSLLWHLMPFHRHDAAANSFFVDLFMADGKPDRESAVYSFSVVDEVQFRDRRKDNVLAYALWAIHGMVPRSGDDFVFLHAGAASRDGNAVLVPAPMEHGKSSLTMAMLLEGFDYLSDELGVLDLVTECAVPFPKRITLHQDSLRFFPGLEERLADRTEVSVWLPQRYVRPEDVGVKAGKPAPVRWLVFPTLDRQGPPRLSPLSRAEAVEYMAANCYNLYQHKDRGVRLLAEIAKGAEAFRLDGGSPGERAALLSEAFA